VRQRFSLDVEFEHHVDSKTDAEKLASDIRSAINAGTFERAVDRHARERREAEETRTRPEQESTANTSPVVTLDTFATIYVERVAKASGKASWKDDGYLFTTVRNYRAADGRRLGEWAIASITEDELEAFLAAQRAVGRAVSTLNHFVQLLKHSFRWAAKKGYISRSPISDDSGLKRGKSAQRSRRLNPDEETAILSAAGSLSRDDAGRRLSGLIIAALETGCRQGELLALLWGDVDMTRRELTVREENAKDGDKRYVPISARLAAVLDMAVQHPAGGQWPATAYVFGALGEAVDSVDKAWETCVLRAHGHEPEWTTNGKLTQVSRVALQAIDLHFHDLRHEAGSRWLEAGMPLHHIKELLGHANISQTDTYLNAGRLVLQDSIRRFDAFRGKLVANEAAIENRPVGHDDTDLTTKDLLH
jgi:integrase